MDILLEGRQAATETDLRTGAGGHFGSAPGAKLFDPAILDFGAAAKGRNRKRDGLTGRTDGPRCRRRGARVREFHDRFQGAMYRVVQKNSCMFEFSHPLSAH